MSFREKKNYTQRRFGGLKNIHFLSVPKGVGTRVRKKGDLGKLLKSNEFIQKRSANCILAGNLHIKITPCPNFWEYVFWGRKKSARGMPHRQKIALRHIPAYSRVNPQQIDHKKHVSIWTLLKSVICLIKCLLKIKTVAKALVRICPLGKRHINGNTSNNMRQEYLSQLARMISIRVGVEWQETCWSIMQICAHGHPATGVQLRSYVWWSDTLQHLPAHGDVESYVAEASAENPYVP